MLYEEETLKLMMDKTVYTNTLGKIESIEENTRICKIKLISATPEEFNLPLIEVPVLRLKNSSQNIVVGDVVVVLFNKWSLEEYFISGLENETKNCLIDHQFDRDNCFAIPLVYDDKVKTNFPEKYTHHEDVIFEKNVKINGTLEVDGSVLFNDTLKVMKKVNFEDELEVQKLIKSLEDVKAITISLLNHVHTYIDSKGSSATPTPSKTQVPE